MAFEFARALLQLATSPALGMLPGDRTGALLFDQATLLFARQPAVAIVVIVPNVAVTTVMPIAALDVALVMTCLLACLGVAPVLLTLD